MVDLHGNFRISKFHSNWMSFQDTLLILEISKQFVKFPEIQDCAQARVIDAKSQATKCDHFLIVPDPTSSSASEISAKSSS